MGPNPQSLPSPVGRQQSRIYTNRAHGLVDSEIDQEGYDQLSGQLAIPISHKHGLSSEHMFRLHTSHPLPFGFKGGVGGSSQFARIVHSFLLPPALSPRKNIKRGSLRKWQGKTVCEMLKISLRVKSLGMVR